MGPAWIDDVAELLRDAGLDAALPELLTGYHTADGRPASWVYAEAVNGWLVVLDGLVDRRALAALAASIAAWDEAMAEGFDGSAPDEGPAAFAVHVAVIREHLPAMREGPFKELFMEAHGLR